MRLQEEARPIPTWVEALTDTFSSPPETHHTPPHSGEKHGTHHTTTLSKPPTPPPPLPPMHLLNSFSLSVFSLYPLHAPNSHGLGVGRGRDPAITILPPAGVISSCSSPQTTILRPCHFGASPAWSPTLYSFTLAPTSVSLAPPRFVCLEPRVRGLGLQCVRSSPNCRQ